MSLRSNPDLPKDTLFRFRLENMSDMKHLLVRLGQSIDWKVFYQEFGMHYAAKEGKPDTCPRLIVGLTYLQFMRYVNDEAVVGRYVESPYWQLFTSEEYFQYEFPLRPTILKKSRRTFGEKGCKWLLKQTFQAGKKLNVLKTSNLGKAVMDTNYLDNSIALLVDSKLFGRMGKAKNKLRTILGRVIRDTGFTIISAKR
jgi:hypothetical protein